MRQFWRLLALPGAHSCIAPLHISQIRVSEGSRTVPSGSQPGMQKPLHHRHRKQTLNRPLTRHSQSRDGQQLRHQTPYQLSVDRRGVEPRFPGCKPGVFPLDQQPILSFQQRSVRELNPVFRLTKEVCGRNTYRPVHRSDPGWSRTIAFLGVTQASSPLDHGIVSSVTEVGVEPTNHEALDLVALPVCVPGRKLQVSGVAPDGLGL